MIGRVVSTKLKNTATVLVERTATHPLYKKTYLQSKKYLVDAQIEVKEGDIVEFINCKPISKRKAFKITKVLGRSLAEIAEEALKTEAAEVIAEVMPEEEKGKAESVKGKEDETAIIDEKKGGKGKTKEVKGKIKKLNPKR